MFVGYRSLIKNTTITSMINIVFQRIYLLGFFFRYLLCLEKCIFLNSFYTIVINNGFLEHNSCRQIACFNTLNLSYLHGMFNLGQICQISF